MAEYIKFRLTAAKVGVTMALLGLIAGLADRAQSKPQYATASFPGTLKVIPLTVVSDLQTLNTRCERDPKLMPLTCVLDSGVLGLDKAVGKIDTALAKLEYKVNTSFLKIKSADAEFLKITDASSEYLKIDAANSQFLKIRATAANSSELGGLTPDAFFQGHGNVVSGATTISANSQSQTLLTLPGGIIVISVAANADQLTITVTNNSGAPIPAVEDGDSNPITIPQGQSNPVPALANNAQAHQIHLQLMPNAAFTDVVTVMISSEPSPTGSGIEVVGQAFTGSV
jgi:hypothetical protein